MAHPPFVPIWSPFAGRRFETPTPLPLLVEPHLIEKELELFLEVKILHSFARHFIMRRA
jgi:hypothetical protein